MPANGVGIHGVNCFFFHFPRERGRAAQAAFGQSLADRLIARRGPPGGVRLLRSAVMAVALVVFLRQLQLYWGPAQALVDALQTIATPLYAVAFLAAVGLIVLVIGRFYGPVASFFLYFAPAALVISLLMVFEEPADTSDYVGYSGAEVAPASTAAPR